MAQVNISRLVDTLNLKGRASVSIATTWPDAVAHIAGTNQHTLSRVAIKASIVAACLAVPLRRVPC